MPVLPPAQASRGLSKPGFRPPTWQTTLPFPPPKVSPISLHVLLSFSVQANKHANKHNFWKFMVFCNIQLFWHSVSSKHHAIKLRLKLVFSFRSFFHTERTFRVWLSKSTALDAPFFAGPPKSRRRFRPFALAAWVVNFSVHNTGIGNEARLLFWDANEEQTSTHSPHSFDLRSVTFFWQPIRRKIRLKGQQRDEQTHS